MATQTTVVSESAGQMSNVKMPRLPLGELGFKYIPAVPVDPGGVGDTLFKLAVRLKQREQPLQGLSRTFTIGGSTARAYNFLFGPEAAVEKQLAAHESLRGALSRDPSALVRILVGALNEQPEEATPGGVRGGDDLTSLALDDPKQWSMSWTTLPEVFTSALPQLDEWAATVDVTQPDKATERLLSDHRPLRPGLQPHSPQESAGPRGGNVAECSSVPHGLLRWMPRPRPACCTSSISGSTRRCNRKRSPAFHGSRRAPSPCWCRTRRPRR